MAVWYTTRPSQLHFHYRGGALEILLLFTTSHSDPGSSVATATSICLLYLCLRCILQFSNSAFERPARNVPAKFSNNGAHGEDVRLRAEPPLACLQPSGWRGFACARGIIHSAAESGRLLCLETSTDNQGGAKCFGFRARGEWTEETGRSELLSADD